VPCILANSAIPRDVRALVAKFQIRECRKQERQMAPDSNFFTPRENSLAEAGVSPSLILPSGNGPTRRIASRH
jgi:hypothetical protein